jgi:glycosyltransferase involved in cell wall biosynthesis
MLVSVVTITYKDLSGLRKTISSVLEQNYKHISYLIVDGGEDLDQILNLPEYNSRIKVVSEPDGGIYDAMNKGAYLSDANYLIYMNSGDTFYGADSLSVLVENIDGNSIVLGGYEAVYSSKYRYKRYVNKPISFIGGMPFCTQSALIPTELIVSGNGFDLNYKIYSDWSWFWDMYNLGVTFIVVDEIVSSFDKTGVSSNGNVLERYNESARVLRSKGRKGYCRIWVMIKNFIKKITPLKVMNLFR